MLVFMAFIMFGHIPILGPKNIFSKSLKGLDHHLLFHCTISNVQEGATPLVARRICRQYAPLISPEHSKLFLAAFMVSVTGSKPY